MTAWPRGMPNTRISSPGWWSVVSESTSFSFPDPAVNKLVSHNAKNSIIAVSILLAASVGHHYHDRSLALEYLQLWISGTEITRRTMKMKSKDQVYMTWRCHCFQSIIHSLIVRHYTQIPTILILLFIQFKSFFCLNTFKVVQKERRIPFQNVQPNHLRFCPCPLSARNPNSPSALLLEYHQAAMFMRSWHLPG